MSKQNVYFLLWIKGTSALTSGYAQAHWSLVLMDIRRIMHEHLCLTSRTFSYELLVRAACINTTNGNSQFVCQLGLKSCMVLISACVRSESISILNTCQIKMKSGGTTWTLVLRKDLADFPITNLKVPCTGPNPRPTGLHWQITEILNSF